MVKVERKGLIYYYSCNEHAKMAFADDYEHSFTQLAAFVIDKNTGEFIKSRYNFEYIIDCFFKGVQ